MFFHPSFLCGNVHAQNPLPQSLQLTNWRQRKKPWICSVSLLIYSLSIEFYLLSLCGYFGKIEIAQADCKISAVGKLTTTFTSQRTHFALADLTCQGTLCFIVLDLPQVCDACSCSCSNVPTPLVLWIPIPSLTVHCFFTVKFYEPHHSPPPSQRQKKSESVNWSVLRRIKYSAVSSLCS